jgi:hypothetical protein
LENFRASLILSRAPKLSTVIEILVETGFIFMKKKGHLSNYDSVIQKFFEEQVWIPEGSCKIVKYPKVNALDEKLFRKIIEGLLSTLKANNYVLKGERSPGKSDRYLQISNFICKIDIHLFQEFFFGFDLYLSRLTEEFERLLEDLDKLKRASDPSTPREALAQDFYEKFYSNEPNKLLREQAKLFRLFVRDWMTLFETMFTAHTVRKYRISYNEWRKDNEEATKEKIDVFNIRFKNLIKSERDHIVSTLKKNLYGHLNCNMYLKNCIEIAMFLTDIFGCYLEEEKTKEVKKLFKICEPGIKMLISFHKFFNPPQGK